MVIVDIDSMEDKSAIVPNGNEITSDEISQLIKTYYETIAKNDNPKDYTVAELEIFTRFFAGVDKRSVFMLFPHVFGMCVKNDMLFTNGNGTEELRNKLSFTSGNEPEERSIVRCSQHPCSIVITFAVKKPRTGEYTCAPVYVKGVPYYFLHTRIPVIVRNGDNFVFKDPSDMLARVRNHLLN